MLCGSGWFGNVFSVSHLVPYRLKEASLSPEPSSSQLELASITLILAWQEGMTKVGFREAVGHGESATFWTVGGVASKQCSNVGMAFEQGLKCSQIVFV